MKYLTPRRLVYWTLGLKPVVLLKGHWIRRTLTWLLTNPQKCLYLNGLFGGGLVVGNKSLGCSFQQSILSQAASCFVAFASCPPGGESLVQSPWYSAWPHMDSVKKDPSEHRLKYPTPWSKGNLPSFQLLFPVVDMTVKSYHSHSPCPTHNHKFSETLGQAEKE